MKKMYLIVRKELDWSHRVVQVGHAVAQACLVWKFLDDFVQWWTINKTMVVYCLDEAGFNDFRDSLDHRVDVTIWKEPDLGGMATAIAIRPMPEENFHSLLALKELNKDDLVLL